MSNEEDDPISELWAYQYYKEMVLAHGGTDCNHSQYEHFQDVLKMCDAKIKELESKNE
tara:strand:+ start:107734 stop:107907 length:174 start_codon:yes stop_codon:yes gene_type:complete